MIVYSCLVPGNPNPTSTPIATAIDGVFVQNLSWFSDQRGSLSVLLRRDQDQLLGGEFGQVYVTTVQPQVVKAWHRHQQQFDRMVGLSGQTLLVLMDGREESPTFGAVVEHVLGEKQHSLVLIPPGVWHGLKCLSSDESMVLNVPTLAYDISEPDEQRAAAHAAPGPGLPAYSWERRDG